MLLEFNLSECVYKTFDCEESEWFKCLNKIKIKILIQLYKLMSKFTFFK